jgi:hypothetical protein
MMIQLFSVVMQLATAIVYEPQTQGLANTSDLNPTIESVRLNVAEPFVHARTHLLKAGWKPVRLHLNDRYEYSGTETIVIKLGFMEVDSCTVDAGSLCTFYYRKADQCLRIDTVGEQLRDMKVLHWMQECSPDEQPAQSRSGAPSGK